jgi:tetratricopeptide (TPR) repeat protein
MRTLTAGSRPQGQKAGIAPLARFPLLFLLTVIFLTSACSNRVQIESAQQAWDSGDFETAVGFYEQFLKDSPRHEKAGYARYQAATIYRRDLKQCDKAIPHYIHLIEDFPNSSDVYNSRIYLAECYGKVEKPREAINEYESLLPYTSDEKEKRRVRTKIAELYYRMNDYGQAIAEYQKVTANAPYDDLSELAWLQIGGIHQLRDEYDEAIPAYQMVASATKDPDIRRQARYRLADFFERTFQYDQAVKILEETESDPKAPKYVPQRIAAIREHQRQRSLSSSSSLGWPKKQ